MTKRDNYHLRELPSRVFQEHLLPDDFRQFVADMVLPRIKFNGYKIDKKRSLASHCVQNLLLNGVVGRTVADSRDTHNAGVRMRAEVWDAIVAANLAHACIGSETTARTTRYYPTAELLEMRRCWDLRFIMDLQLGRNSQVKPGSAAVPLALVVLHMGKIDLGTGLLLPEERRKTPIHFMDEVNRLAQRGADGQPDPRAVANGMRYWRDVEDAMERINESALSHSWQAYCTDPIDGRRRVFQPNPMLRQLHVGQFFRASRLYGWSEWAVQSLPRAVRQTILIDGEPVTEFDFSGMATRMLYHMAGHDPTGDVYRPEAILPQVYGWQNLSDEYRGVARDFVKRATNICWNVKTRSSANSAVGLLLADSPQGEFLHKAIFQIEKTNAAGIVERIMVAHPVLADRFFTEVGMDLMTRDGLIMKGILSKFAEHGRAATGIHDAVLCKAGDAEFAIATMAQIYNRHMNFEPVIHRSY